MLSWPHVEVDERTCPQCITQASPYVIFLFALPVHFWVHLGMLFFTGVWTTNIHDTINGANARRACC